MPRTTAVVSISLARRRLFQWLTVPAAQWLLPSNLFASSIASARLWPAQEYTRLIIESVTPLGFQWMTMRNPERLLLDLDGVEMSFELVQLPQLVHPDDPYIQAIRVAPLKPGVMRIVLDLKTEVNPQIFALKPFADHAHRIVLDLYPLTPPDPLMALLQADPNAREYAPRPGAADRPATAPEPRPPASRSEVRRKIVIAIDPGHGGEDPGAIGRRGTYEKNVTLAIARKLRSLIDGEPGMRAMLTRDDDYFVALHVRVQKARSLRVDPRRCLQHAQRARLIGLRAFRTRRYQRSGSLACSARERGGLDRRSESRQQGSAAREDAARLVSDGADQ